MNDAGFIGRKDEYHVLEKCYHSKDAQIDLVIDHRDNVASLCEMKFTMNEFEINKDIYMDLMNKIAAFQSENKRKSVQTVLITTYGLKEIDIQTLSINA